MRRSARGSRRSGDNGGPRLIRLLLGGSLVAALVGAAPAAAARPTHISATESPSTALVGQPLVVSGRAFPASPGRSLTVVRLVAGRWQTVARVRESATGAYSVSLKAPGKPGAVELRVLGSATSKTRAAASATLSAHVVTAAFAVRAHAATTVPAGTPITVNGDVSPTTSGTVTLQGLLAGRWVRVATSRLAGSRFVLVATEPAGTYHLRVLSPMTRTRAAGVSHALTVTVAPPASPVLPQPAPPSTPAPVPVPVPPVPTPPTQAPIQPIPPLTVPGAPVLSVTLGTSTATLHWTPPSDDGGSVVTGYRASRDGTDTSGFGADTASVAGDVLSWTFDELKTGEPYTFSVVAVNEAGSGPPDSVTAGGTGPSAWPLAGRDLGNTRSNPDEHVIGDTNVSQLQKRWSVPFAGNLTGTPSVVDGAVYLPDRSGSLSSFDAATGAVRWTHPVSTYTGLTGDSTRNTAVAGGRLVFGDRPGSGQGSRLVAVNAATGTLLWATIIDTQPSSQITGAPTIDGNVVYIGVSSKEEESATCCSFRGSVVAVDVTTGAVLWKTYTAPVGYTGNAVWSSAPVVDHATGLLYVGTGNNYTVPVGVCTAPGETGCTPPASNDYVDALLALRLTTGTPAWALSTLSSDVSSHVCSTPTTCGPDFDFGSDPNLFTATINGTPEQLLGIGQKSGIYWAVDAATGALVWQTRVGPGGTGGGIQWGSATDGLRIYVAEVNDQSAPWSLEPSGVPTTGGFFSALDPATGEILWQTADPQGAKDFGYVSVANGVVYAGSGAGSGTTMYALSAQLGTVLWSYASGASVMGGAAVVDGRVYWASGYYTNNCPPASTTCGKTYALYSFGLPGT